MQVNFGDNGLIIYLINYLEIGRTIKKDIDK